MSKFFAVTITHTAIVRAASAEDAKQAARDDMHHILSDATDPDDIEVVEEVTAQSQLSKHGWNGMCIPYGDTDGNTRLSEYLPATKQ